MRQRFVIAGFLFITVVDWIMRNTNNRKRGIRWKFTSTQEDLNYTNDLAPISSKYSDILGQTARLNDVGKYTGLNINVNKTKSRRIKGEKNDTIDINNKGVEEVQTFIYLGATIDKTGWTEAEIKTRLRLARFAFFIP